jgi:hypothetical protein
LAPLATFDNPTAATRFITAEEAKKTSRLDFTPVAGFAPANSGRITRPRTEKMCGSLPKTAGTFAAWIKQYFSQIGEIPAGGIPTMQVVAAATRAGFPNPRTLLEQLKICGVLCCPKPYAIAPNQKSAL